MAERLNAPDCKSGPFGYGGSNPPPSTIFYLLPIDMRLLLQLLCGKRGAVYVYRALAAASLASDFCAQQNAIRPLFFHDVIHLCRWITYRLR